LILQECHVETFGILELKIHWNSIETSDHVHVGIIAQLADYNGYRSIFKLSLSSPLQLMEDGTFSTWCNVSCRITVVAVCVPGQLAVLKLGEPV